jgi:hypothetical protein
VDFTTYSDSCGYLSRLLMWASTVLVVKRACYHHHHHLREWGLSRINVCVTPGQAAPAAALAVGARRVGAASAVCGALRKHRARHGEGRHPRAGAGLGGAAGGLVARLAKLQNYKVRPHSAGNNNNRHALCRYNRIEKRREEKTNLGWVVIGGRRHAEQ